jgi:tetratricopeptide (TPR) repeat protein
VSSSKRFKGPLLSAAIAAIAFGVAYRARTAVLPKFDALKPTSDVYALPQPEQLNVVSLGYRAALADLIFAHVLVWHGLHFQEKRRFEFAAEYLDAVTTLDPQFRDPYYYGDTLIAVQAGKPTREDYIRARRLLERGMRERPDDTELWLSSGQFIAYVAAPWLEDPKERDAWRLEGARRMARACELVGSNENIPYNCISAATVFSRTGERDALIRFLERILSVSDDEAIRDYALAKLRQVMGEQELERFERRASGLREAWRKDLGFVSLTSALVVGPSFEPASCAGDARTKLECATSWYGWRERRKDSD